MLNERLRVKFWDGEYIFRQPSWFVQHFKHFNSSGYGDFDSQMHGYFLTCQNSKNTHLRVQNREASLRVAKHQQAAGV